MAAETQPGVAAARQRVRELGARIGSAPGRAATKPAAPAVGATIGVPLPNRHQRGRFLSRPLMLAAVAGAAAFLLFTHGGRDARPIRPLLENVDRLAEAMGLGVDQVELSGYRMTSESEIFAALDLTNVRSLVRFDSVAVRARIERLPWIKTAAVTRMIPGAVSIVVAERAPFAVWQDGAREILIDRDGRTLSPVKVGGAAHLPRVAGDGAPQRALAILSLVGRYAELGDQLVAAERVADRRWSLRLSGDRLVHLPEYGEVDALDRLMAPPAGQRLIDRPYAVIDLRVPGRTALRRQPQRVAGADTIETERPRGAPR